MRCCAWELSMNFPGNDDCTRYRREGDSGRRRTRGGGGGGVSNERQSFQSLHICIPWYPLQMPRVFIIQRLLIMRRLKMLWLGVVHGLFGS